MKKTILLFLVAILFISCDESIPQDLTTKQIFNLTAHSYDWNEYTEKSGLNRYYSCTFSLGEINSTIYDDGAVIAYIEIDGRQQILPFVRHYEDSNGAMWTRTVDFDYSNGDITFYVTNSDFIKAPPETTNFRVMLMW